jgi:hypothetical protein
LVTQDGDLDTWRSSGSSLELSFYIFSNQLYRFAGSVRKGSLSITPSVIYTSEVTDSW